MSGMWRTQKLCSPARAHGASRYNTCIGHEHTHATDSNFAASPESREITEGSRRCRICTANTEIPHLRVPAAELPAWAACASTVLILTDDNFMREVAVPPARAGDVHEFLVEATGEQDLEYQDLLVSEAPPTLMLAVLTQRTLRGGRGAQRAGLEDARARGLRHGGGRYFLEILPQDLRDTDTLTAISSCVTHEIASHALSASNKALQGICCWSGPRRRVFRKVENTFYTDPACRGHIL